MMLIVLVGLYPNEPAPTWSCALTHNIFFFAIRKQYQALSGMLSVYVACSAADVAPMLAEQAAVEKKMETLQVAAPEEPTVSGPEAVGSEPVPKVRLQSKTQRCVQWQRQLCSPLHPRYCLAHERRHV